MSERRYWFMNNWIQSVPERGRLHPQRRRLAAAPLLMLLMLGVVLLWSPVRTNGQSVQINTIGNINAAADSQIVVEVTFTNFTPATPIQASYSLTPLSTGSPNASIDQNGVFRWGPTNAQVVSFTVTVSNTITPFAFTSTNFNVTVTNSATPVSPPSLKLLFTSPTNITIGMTLTFTAIAAMTDGSSDPLTFSLADTNGLPNGVPPGASINAINATSGVFTWTPAPYQANGEYPMEVIVTEAKTNISLSATQVFTVGIPPLVNDCAQYSNVLWTVANGGDPLVLDNCPILVLTNTLTVTASNVFLIAGTNGVSISGNKLLRLFTVLPGASLTLNGVTLIGGQSDSGGAMYNMDGGTVVLGNCIVAGNNAVGAGGSNGVDGDSDPNYGRNGADASPGLPGVGGAVFNLGGLTANNCQFTNNSATGGIGGNGGNGSSANYRGGNGGHGGNGALGFGGAIYSAGGFLSLNNCTFFGNTDRKSV